MGKKRQTAQNEKKKNRIIHSIILSGSSQNRNKKDISNHPNESTRKTNRKRWSTNDTSN